MTDQSHVSSVCIIAADMKLILLQWTTVTQLSQLQRCRMCNWECIQIILVKDWLHNCQFKFHNKNYTLF